MTAANGLRSGFIFALRASLAIFLLSNVCVVAQESRPSLDAETAKTIIAGCEHYAASNNISVAIVVAGPGDLLAAVLRMDGVVPGAVEVAIWKARSSSLLGMSTSDLANLARESPTISSVPGVAAISGGLPIFAADGALIGGVGVSGASEDHDVACALAGLDAASLNKDEDK